jgi:tripartite-type tricarboxylate transporter receptor subunit TctC
MNLPRRQVLHLMAGAATLPAVLRVARAQAYPLRPVHIIVPFAPGGPPDVIARIVAQKLTERLGQQFVVENLPGAGGNRGTATAERAPADGYTLVAISTGFFVNPSLYAKVDYDPVKGFAPISLVATSPNVVMVNPSVPANTLKELIDLVKANPGKYSYAHPSTGSTSHLSGELLKLRFGLDVVTVPFNGGPPAITSTIGGHTPIAIIALPAALANVREGKVRALAVTSARRVPSLPDIPTMAEAGATDQEAETLNGLLAPAGTPREIVDQLYGEIAKIMALPDVADHLSAMGFEPIFTTPEQFSTRIDTEISKWGKVIREAKIKID